MNLRHFLVLGILALLLGGGVSFLPPPFAAMESEVAGLKYRLRGPLQPDSSIALVYIDEDAVKALGWPVRRNFYALMIKALADLHARAVGVEIMFEDPQHEFPEYDDLLANVARASGTVVLPCYFEQLEGDGGHSGRDSLGLPFLYPGVQHAFCDGDGLHLPFSLLSRNVAGIGHVNYSGETDIPLFVRTASGNVPAFALEILRVSLGAERAGVIAEGSAVRIVGPAGVGEFSVSGGKAALNFCGPLTVFPRYPFMQVLTSYDALRANRAVALPVASLKGKTVLLGVIAEGRSQFSRTPIDPRYPSLGLHVTFLDNALQNRFLRTPPIWMSILLVVLLSLGVGAMVLGLRERVRWWLVCGVVFAFLLASFVLFSVAAINLPVTPLLVTALCTAVVAQVLRHQATRRQLDSLAAEKQQVLARLADREAKVALLERELLNVQTVRSADRIAGLLEEIRKYRAEIQTLASQADDMEEFRASSGTGEPQQAEFEGIIYDRDGPMKSVVQFIGKIAGTDAPVLILGESGTGKELVAKAIHKRSNRSTAPFVAVNCGALSENLLESELFGHERGAFTGAVKEKAGRFEIAHRGTIFLDEIGEVSEAFQVKLLRVLQEGEFERVGGTKTLRADVRVLAATNRDLKEQVQARKFREDLYYRLNVLSISLPPLRGRQGDITVLVDHFLHKEGSGLSVSRNVMQALQGYSWRGNVRELESVMKRAALLARAEGRAMVTVKDLTEELSVAARNARAVEDQVLDALREKGFSRSSISESADELGGLNRGTVAEYLRGECLKAFVEYRFDREQTVRHIALTTDKDVLERVSRKLDEYLENLVQGIDRSQPWDGVRVGLKPKMKNLSQRYHPFLEAVVEGYYRGVWN
jgi:transcriptional regulator with GAF, ATPase, and Fis domain/CHASE2 domain-containing sensor protein